MRTSIQGLDGVDIELIERMAKRIWPHLQTLPALAQGGVIAALLAKWIYGHEIVGDVAATLDLRERLLQRHNLLVNKLLQAEAEDDNGDTP